MARRKSAGAGRWLVRLGLGLVVLLGLLLGLLWLAASQPASLRWIVAQVESRLGGQLKVEALDGSLLGPLSAGTVRWASDGLVVTAHGARFAWQPLELLNWRARVDLLEASRIEVDLSTPAQPSPKDPSPIRLPERIALPLSLSVGRMASGEVVVRRDGNELVRVADLEAVATAGPDLVELNGLNARVIAAGNEVAVGGEVSIRPVDTWQTRARVQSRMDLQGQPLRVELRADGQLAALDTRLNAQWADARVTARTQVHALDPRPLRDLKVEVSELDLARIDPALPQTDIAARLEAELFPAWSDRPDPPLLVGPLEISNQLAGPLDVKRLPVARLRTVTSLTAERVELQDLNIGGPAGEINGLVRWAANGFRVEARSDGLKLAAIQRSLQPRTVVLDARVSSDRPLAERAIDFELRALDNEVTATTQGRLRGDWLDLSQLGVQLAAVADGPGAGRLPAGQAKLAGRLRIAEPFDLDLAGTISELQPHRLVQMAPATFNGTVSARGTLGGQGSKMAPGRVELDLAVADSEVDGRALAGHLRGALHLHAFQPRSVDGVDAAFNWADATARLAGGLGEGSSALTVDLVVPQLKTWLPEASGDIRGNARLHGALTAPALDLADIVVRKLSVASGGQQISAEKLTLLARNLQLDLAVPLDLQLQGSALRVAPVGSRRRSQALLDLDTLDAEVSGTPAAHRIALRGDGRNQLLRLLADGAVLKANGRAAGTSQDRAKAAGGTRAAKGANGVNGAHGAAPTAGGLAAITGWRGQVQQLELRHPQLLMPGGGAARPAAATPVATAAGAAATTAASAAQAAAQAPAQAPASASAAAAGGTSARSSDAGLLRAERPFEIRYGGGATPSTVVVDGLALLLQGARLEVQRLNWANGRLDTALQGGGLPAYWITRIVPIDALYTAQVRQERAVTPSRPAGSRTPAPPSDPLVFDLTANFAGQVADTSAADWSGQFALRRQRGDLYLLMPASDEGYVAAGLDRLALRGAIERQRLTASLDLDGSTIGNANGQVDIPLIAGPGPFWADEKLARTTLGGQLGMSMRSLRWVSPLVGETWRIDGALASNLKLAGTLAEPRLLGAVTGADLSAVDQETGMRLHDGVLAAELSGDRVDVMLLRFLSGEGSVAMDGLLRVPAAGATSQARIQIEKLPIPLGAAQRIVVSGNAVAELHDERSMSITGRLVADEGVIEVRGNDAPTLGNDVVIVDERGRQIDARDGKTVVQAAPRRRAAAAAASDAAAPGTSASGSSASGTTAAAKPASTAASTSAGAGSRAAAAQPFRISTALDIDMGPHFRVFGSGINARLTGAIKLSGVLPEQPRADGVVKIVDGTYQIYGRRLDITEGEVRFNGPVDNPTLLIVAARRYLQVEPRVEITGTAANPVIKLTSEPEVSDAEKLSWLILGTGLDEAQGAGQLLLLQAAADSLFGDEDSKYADSLTDRLGIDMLSIKDESSTSSATGQPQGTVVTVGKRLSNRLFVTYEQSLRGVWNIVKLQYDITNRLSVSVQAGSDSAADLLWNFPFD